MYKPRPVLTDFCGACGQAIVTVPERIDRQQIETNKLLWDAIDKLRADAAELSAKLHDTCCTIAELEKEGEHPASCTNAENWPMIDREGTRIYGGNLTGGKTLVTENIRLHNELAKAKRIVADLKDALAESMKEAADLKLSKKPFDPPAE